MVGRTYLSQEKAVVDMAFHVGIGRLPCMCDARSGKFTVCYQPEASLRPSLTAMKP